MTRFPDLSSAESKFERAKLHAHELLEDIRIWTEDQDDPPVRIGLEDDLKYCRTLAYAKSIKGIPPDWSLKLGDALHNYRSALNYVAGELVLSGRTPAVFSDPNSKFQFPICETTRKDFFNGRGVIRKSQLPGVQVKYLRAISPLQPYKRGKSHWALPALKLLNDLDKHRNPILAAHHVAFQMAAVPLGYGDSPPVATFKSLRPRGRVKPGAKLAHLIWLTGQRPIILVPPYGPLLGKPDMTMYFTAPAAVVLEDLPSVRVVRNLIEAIDGLIEDVVRRVRLV